MHPINSIETEAVCAPTVQNKQNVDNGMDKP